MRRLGARIGLVGLLLVVVAVLIAAVHVDVGLGDGAPRVFGNAEQAQRIGELRFRLCDDLLLLFGGGCVLETQDVVARCAQFQRDRALLDGEHQRAVAVLVRAVLGVALVGGECDRGQAGGRRERQGADGENAKPHAVSGRKKTASCPTRKRPM